MRITRLVFENYLAFKNKTEINNLRQINYFIGKNGVGKTNIKNSFPVFRQLFSDSWKPNQSDYYDNIIDSKLRLGFELEINENEMVTLIENHRSRLSELKIVDEQLSNSFKIQYNVEFYQQNKQKETWKIIDKDGTKYVVLDLLLNESHKKIYYRQIDQIVIDICNLTSPTIEYKPINNRSTNIANIWPELQLFLINQFELVYMNNDRMVVPSASAQEHHGIPINGQHFVNYHNTIFANDDDRIRDYVEDISKLSNKTITKVKSVPIKQNVKLKIREQGSKTERNFEQLGSGQKDMLLFPNIRHVQNSLCIEEPELHKHPSAQKQTLEIIKNIASKTPDMQFFIETHSPIFTGTSNNEATILLIKSSEGYTQIVDIDADNIEIIRQELGINYSDVFDHDYFLFVEGSSEFRAFPIIAKTLEYNIDQVKCWNIGGSSNTKYLDFLLEHIAKTKRKIAIILDNDDGTKSTINKLLKTRLIQRENIRVLEKSFEDTFTSEQIEIGLSKTMCRKSANNITKEQLDKLRKTSRVSNILKDYECPKPDLAVHLANQITKGNVCDNDFAKYIKEFLQDIFNLQHIS